MNIESRVNDAQLVTHYPANMLDVKFICIFLFQICLFTLNQKPRSLGMNYRVDISGFSNRQLHIPERPYFCKFKVPSCRNVKYEAHIISTQLNLMPFPYKILVQEMNYLHANSVVKNTTSLLTKYKF